MAGAQTVWGIDVGRCALKAIKLRAAGDGKVEILAHDYIEHAKILSQPDADRNALIAAALEKFLSHNDISKDQVVVGVPAQHTLSRFTKLPPVQQKRVPDIVRYEAAQQIPFDMDEVIWDYQIFQEEGAPDLEVGIFAVKRELLREHLLHFEQVAIEPMAVQSGPLAVYNAAVFDGVLGNDTTLILDIGADSTDLVIGAPNAASLWSRTIQIGGNHLTETLVKSFKLPFVKAETLKRTASSSKYARQIFQAMRPIFADLVGELQRSIGYYSSSHREVKIEKIVAVGNAMALPGLQKYLQQNLGLPVEKPEAFRNVAAPAAAGSQLLEQHLSFWAAYGLALQGLDLTKVTTNLLPTEIAKQVVWRKKRPAFAASAACLLLAGGLIMFRYNADTSALAASGEGAESVKVADVDRAAQIIDSGPPQSSDRAWATWVLKSAETLRRKNDELSKQGTDQIDEVEQLASLQKNKTLVPAIVRVVHDAIPTVEAASKPFATATEWSDAVIPTPRGERKIVRIESFDMRYLEDTNAPPWKDSLVTVPKDIEDRENQTVSGFKLEITCQTPNAEGQKYIQTYMDALRTKGRAPNMGFYFDRVYLIVGGKGKSQDPNRGNQPSEDKPSGEGAPTKLDPVTNEPMDNDWRFEIWADVVLKDFEPPTSEEDEPEKTDGE